MKLEKKLEKNIRSKSSICVLCEHNGVVRVLDAFLEILNVETLNSPQPTSIRRLLDPAQQHECESLNQYLKLPIKYKLTLFLDQVLYHLQINACFSSSIFFFIIP